MADEDTACIEENTPAISCEAQWHVSKHVNRSAGWAQQAASQKPGAARVNRKKTCT